MRRTPGRTTMQHGGGTDRTAAPQGPCPLPSTARRTGIGSRDEKRSKVSRSGAFGRQSRTKAPASRPWIHDALSLLSPLARCLRRLTTAARPCGTRAVFAATAPAACAAVKIHVSRNTISTVWNRAKFFVMQRLLHNRRIFSHILLLNLTRRWRAPLPRQGDMLWPRHSKKVLPPRFSSLFSALRSVFSSRILNRWRA